ncbi:MAG TPA: PDZ domain-containing protein, partial [Dehalococcoidales bacterium]|nr:PDZ domain-containing protein [Dehalococcoidales bacterium]
KVVQVGVEGMGYAISSQVAVPIINELIANGFVARPWIGTRLYTVDSFAINQLDLKVKSGVLITEVVASGPASKAGLRRFDVITALNNQEVKTVEGLVKLIRSQKIGDVVQITFWRDNAASTVKVTLEQSPAS